MASIFLSGGGYANKTKKLDDIFRNSVRNPERMLFIPVAMPPEIFSFGECYDWICSVFPEIGFSRIDMWTNLRNRVIADVRKYSAIYFGGGNTFSLLHEIRNAGLIN